MVHLNELKIGDLLFIATGKSDFENAIKDIFVGFDNQSFSHVGIYVGDNVVIEANTKDGVVKSSLEDFINDNIVYLGRVENNEMISSAIQKLNDYVGLPYNFSYVYNGESFYCSELIYDVFPERYFSPHKISFKNAEGSIDQFWIDYYKEKFNMEVPEGIDGSHPTTMTLDPSIKMLGKIEIS